MTRPNNPRWRIRTDSLAALAVSLLPLVYFFPATRGNLIISPDDGVIFNVPMRVVVANLIHSGYVPLWNPYMFGGMPLFGAAQAGVLFPLNWFYLIFSSPVATNLMMLATYMLAALGAYLYARRSGASIAGAAATSLVWQWSAFMVAKVGQTNVVQTAALLPWVLWAVDRYGMTGKRSHGLVLALLVAVQIFAGHQQTFAYSFLLAAAYAIVMARTSAHRERRSYLLALVLLSTGVILAAVQILPTVELLRNSLRATASYDFFSSFSMPPRFVLTLFAPFVMGGGDGHLFRAPYIGPAFVGEYIAYVGAATMMLALVALLLKPDTRTKFWAVLAVVCLALAIGRFLPVNIYKLVYYIPVLNLFRVPARHLMEVEFALAVLAGRGLTAIAARSQSERAKVLRLVAAAGGLVFLFTCLTVSWWRPAGFRLGRLAPVTILRAPELFLPILIAGLSAVALWFFARNVERRYGRALTVLFAIVILDLCLWGQASGWRQSPTPVHPLWSEPESVRLLRNLQHERGDTPNRILTDVQPFFINTGRDEVEKFKLGEFMLSLQPDTYVMHGVENAAGYDGFGLTRYSKLADDMKLWGELTDAGRSVRGPGREFDILNVRYLLKQSPQGEARRRAAEQSPAAAAAPLNNAPSLIDLGGLPFGKEELGAPSLIDQERLVFATPPVEANSIALITSLAWATEVADGEVVGYVRLRAEDGKRFEFQLRAGEHTSEWSHERPDLKTKIGHRLAPVATSSPVVDPSGNFESHTFVAQFKFPEMIRVTGGEIEVAGIKNAPRLTLDVKRVSLLKNGVAEPLRGDWVEKLPAREGDPTNVADAASIGSGRWRLVADAEYLQIYENSHALPRAWLANEEVVASEQDELAIIRSGKLPGGKAWDPLQTVLVEKPTSSVSGTSMVRGSADVTRHEPNRAEIKTASVAPAILVLSENHYPGWRAYVDGKSVDVIRVNYNLRGVAVPAGNHLVEFVYRPKSVLAGLAVSLLTLLSLLFWWSRAR
jgi:hypothetical protein